MQNQTETSTLHFNIMNMPSSGRPTKPGMKDTKRPLVKFGSVSDDAPWPTDRTSKNAAKWRAAESPSFDKRTQREPRPDSSASCGAGGAAVDNTLRELDRGGCAADWDDCSAKEAQLRRVAQDQRRKREAGAAKENALLAHVSERARQRRSSQAPSHGGLIADGSGEALHVQGVLSSEIGLVAPAASRRGPVIRPNVQDITSAFPTSGRADVYLAQERAAGGRDSAFGFVSLSLHEESERAQHARAARKEQYRRDLTAQVSQDRLRKVGEQRQKAAGADQQLGSELKHLERERVECIRQRMLREAEAEGINPAYLQGIARMQL